LFSAESTKAARFAAGNELFKNYKDVGPLEVFQSIILQFESYFKFGAVW
jgi:hypothetical protein